MIASHTGSSFRFLFIVSIYGNLQYLATLLTEQNPLRIIEREGKLDV